MKKISRRSFLAAAGLSVAALALTACGGSSASTASSVASSAASSEAASTSAAAGELTTVEAGKLTMATNATFPPYEMTTDAGEFEGIDIETAQAIADKLGLELQIDDMDFDAALLSVQQGKRGDKVCGFAKASPFGRGAEQREAERASPFQAYNHFSLISTFPDTCATTPSSLAALRNPGSCCSSTASALPRWLMASFSSGVSWA